jgi:hypothetical protein
MRPRSDMPQVARLAGHQRIQILLIPSTEPARLGAGYDNLLCRLRQLCFFGESVQGWRFERWAWMKSEEGRVPTMSQGRQDINITIAVPWLIRIYLIRRLGSWCALFGVCIEFFHPTVSQGRGQPSIIATQLQLPLSQPPDPHRTFGVYALLLCQPLRQTGRSQPTLSEFSAIQALVRCPGRGTRGPKATSYENWLGTFSNGVLEVRSITPQKHQTRGLLRFMQRAIHDRSAAGPLNVGVSEQIQLLSIVVLENFAISRRPRRAFLQHPQICVRRGFLAM